MIVENRQNTKKMTIWDFRSNLMHSKNVCKQKIYKNFILPLKILRNFDWWITVRNIWVFFIKLSTEIAHGANHGAKKS